jgi:type IV pilus assembly protein PilQ
MSSQGTVAPTAAPEKATNTPAAKPSTAGVDLEHDARIKEILSMASKKQWVQAEAKAADLVKVYPDDEAAQRIANWITTEGREQRAKALEDDIRDIETKQDTTFNPTVQSLLTDKGGGAQPLRKDVRDAVQQIEAEPYIPDSFGKVIRRTETLNELETEAGAMSKLLEKPITVHLENATLESIIFNIGQAEGINFVADKNLPAFKQSLSVNMDKVKLGEFLRYVARNMEVQFQVGNDLIWIVDAKDPKRLLEETRVFHLKNGFVVPAQFGPLEVPRVVSTVNNVTTVTEGTTQKRFVNDGAPAAPSLEAAITNFFIGSKCQIDYERNLVIARGTAEQLRELEKIIETFDKPLQQVLIEARFITVSQSAFTQLGVSWQMGGTGIPRSPADFTGLGAIGANNIGTGAGITAVLTNGFFTYPNGLSQPDLSATLSALQQSGESQTLSAPRLTVVNNRPAMIQDGQVQYYYDQYTVQQSVGQYFATASLVPTGKPVQITAGISLYVLASIGGDGKSVLLALNPQVNQGVIMQNLGSINTGTSNQLQIMLPTYTTQELATRVVVKSGETVAMGGVLERQQETVVEGTPLLSRLPLLGALFRKSTQYNQPRYLLIFVTATLLNENGEMVVPEDSTRSRHDSVNHSLPAAKK